jgi:hypothetical protein
MSQDQRPGRVRVFSTGAPANTPQRRHTDRQPIVENTPAAATGTAPARRLTIVGALLFLVGSAIGGVVATRYGLAGMLGR